MINKLLNEVITSRGMSDELTLALCRLADRGIGYDELLAIKEATERAEADEEW